jgi:SPP1 gp7 family putative phage head morphogenesis protein
MPAPRFHPPSRIEILYRNAISQLMSSILPRPPMFVPIEQWLSDLATRGTTEQAIGRATRLAEQMVQWTDSRNAKSWQMAARQASHGRLIYRLQQEYTNNGSIARRLWELREENTRLITSLPGDVAKYLVRETQTAQRQGTRPEAIAKTLQVRYPQLAQSRINLLARTTTAQASSALTQARSEELDLPAYVWMTAEDQRVRKSHAKMNGVVCLWAAPPNPEALVGEKSSGAYNSGSIYSCRCTQKVLLSLDDVSWPHSVAYAGEIKKFTRAQFAQLTGLQRRMAA